MGVCCEGVSRKYEVPIQAVIYQGQIVYQQTNQPNGSFHVNKNKNQYVDQQFNKLPGKCIYQHYAKEKQSFPFKTQNNIAFRKQQGHIVRNNKKKPHTTQQISKIQIIIPDDIQMAQNKEKFYNPQSQQQQQQQQSKNFHDPETVNSSKIDENSQNSKVSIKFTESSILSIL